MGEDDTFGSTSGARSIDEGCQINIDSLFRWRKNRLMILCHKLVPSQHTLMAIADDVHLLPDKDNGLHMWGLAQTGFDRGVLPSMGDETFGARVIQDISKLFGFGGRMEE